MKILWPIIRKNGLQKSLLLKILCWYQCKKMVLISTIIFTGNVYGNSKGNSLRHFPFLDQNGWGTVNDQNFFRNGDGQIWNGTGTVPERIFKSYYFMSLFFFKTNSCLNVRIWNQRLFLSIEKVKCKNQNSKAILSKFT